MLLNRWIPADNPHGIPVSWYGTTLRPNAVRCTFPQITLPRGWSVTPRVKIIILLIYPLPALGRRERRFDSSSAYPQARGDGGEAAAPPALRQPIEPAMKINEDQCLPSAVGLGGIAGRNLVGSAGKASEDILTGVLLQLCL